MNTWHLIIDAEPLKGSLNMAVDEFLFRSLAGGSRTYVRFYRWERPTASLGYSQKTENVIDLEFCRRNGIDVVRRITGGKLVLHHREITYSVCSSETGAFTGTLAGSYKLISQALARGLRRMGLEASLAGASPPFYAKGDLPCFSQPARDEIEVNGKKIVGSAQKRIGTSFLQHGSIPLVHDEGLLKAVSRLGDDPAEIRMTSLSEALGRPVDFDWAVARLVEGFEDFFGVRFDALEMTDADKKNIDDIRTGKYEDDNWTRCGTSSLINGF